MTLEYLLISQDHWHVERCVRQSDGVWLMREVAESDALVALDSVAVVLPISEVYRQVIFKDENPSG